MKRVRLSKVLSREVDLLKRMSEFEVDRSASMFRLISRSVSAGEWLGRLRISYGVTGRKNSRRGRNNILMLA